MSLNFFHIDRGLELDNSVQYLQGATLPGLGGDTSTAPVGSLYTNNSDGSVWTKILSGAGGDKWLKLASEQHVDLAVAAARSGVSWREPVIARDSASTALPTGTAGSAINIDGISIVDGQRVLFSELIGGNGKNIYVYNQAAGTFVEDVNTETAGDATYVQSGTSGGKTYVFNGTTWVLTDQAPLTEIGFIQSFIGKDSTGSDMPVYSTTNFVSNGTSLETAVGALDAELGANVVDGAAVLAANSINQNIQALDTALSEVSLTTTATNVTTQQVVDSITAGAAKWLVRVELVSDATAVYATEVYALSDGTATGSDFTRYGSLSLGAAISGLIVTVDAVGGALRLLVEASSAVNVSARRVSIIA